MVINGRVLRKLCEACKEGFTPDPATLKKLNLSAESSTTLYKAREQPMRDAKGNPIPCEFCHDLRFKGALGVFEILLADDDVKCARRSDAGKSLSQPFRKQKGRYLQEEALAVWSNTAKPACRKSCAFSSPVPKPGRPAAAAARGQTQLPARPAAGNRRLKRQVPIVIATTIIVIKHSN